MCDKLVSLFSLWSFCTVEDFFCDEFAFQDHYFDFWTLEPKIEHTTTVVIMGT